MVLDQDDTDEDPQIMEKRNDVEIRNAIERMIKEALDEGFSVTRGERLRTIMYKYDVWRVVLGDDPPARVPPLSLKMKAGLCGHTSIKLARTRLSSWLSSTNSQRKPAQQHFTFLSASSCRLPRRPTSRRELQTGSL